MTHDDLATLLRDHVSHDEPPALLPTRSVIDGRRRLRTRRLTAAAGTAAALVLVGAIGVPLLTEDGPVRDPSMDPTSFAALQEYDVQRMPDLMDEHVRDVLERSVPDLGGSTFTALGADNAGLPAQQWDEARTLSVTYGSSEHTWKVSISRAASEAEGNKREDCREGLADGSYLECTVARTDDSDLVVDKLQAVSPLPDGSWRLLAGGELATVPLGQIWFDREITVVKSVTLTTHASERVQATDRDPATAAFATPNADLVAIGTDPELVMPAPPRAEAP
jgi:hypothetical protein